MNIFEQLLEQTGLDILQYMLVLLDLDDLYSMMQVSKGMLQLCTKEELWKAIIERDFDICTDERGIGKTSMETYKNNVFLSKEKKQLFENNTSPMNDGMGGFRNIKDGIAAYCMRGELDELKKQLNPVKVNEPVPFYSWIYYGNYSSSFNAFIQYDAQKMIFVPGVNMSQVSRGSGEIHQKLWASPLHWACLGNQLDVAKYLCSIEGIYLEPEIADHNATPLDIAVTNGYAQLAKFLHAQINKKKVKIIMK